MRIRRVAVLLMIPLLVELVIACCDCPEVPYTNYDRSSFYTHSDLIISSIDNSGANPVIPVSDSVQKCAYGIRVLIDRVRQEGEMVYHPHGLMQSAYAFDCWCNDDVYFIPADTILSIDVITLNDFDATHPVNSSVAEHFKVFNSYSYLSIEDFIHDEFHYTSIEDLDTDHLQFNLLLMSEPAIGKYHQFTIRVELTDGRVMERTTKTVTLF